MHMFFVNSILGPVYTVSNPVHISWLQILFFFIFFFITNPVDISWLQILYILIDYNPMETEDNIDVDPRMCM